MSLSANFEAHSLGKYRNLNNSLKKPCNLARRSYIRNLAKELKENNNLKPFWSFVTSAREGTNNLVSLLVDGVTLTDDLSIAQSLNQFTRRCVRPKIVITFLILTMLSPPSSLISIVLLTKLKSC